MKILVLDNYDSFTYNLVHYLEELTDAPVDVFRNDQITIEEAAKYDKIVLSPGPGIPDEAGILKPLIKALAPTHSIFGVCLGCQAIAEVFGGSILNLSKVYHGIATPVLVTDKEEILFKGLPDKFPAGRYHSWVVRNEDLPDDLIVTSVDEEGQIMGLRHKTLDVRGVQFHPESILTEHGKTMIKNWLLA
ncbi:anthranilate synthase component II [Alkalitalea saponilacus]|uniref:Anthranilate synthase component 2 n=1 Tax=Alkalitalea saponilacus TaxID=889453 RepID=A0A1T5AXB2_9BACT|nr:aminodeoxychorismate/anthranilate synthase component II [Alkalitalea saponilacus]ASB48563.1 aminodeoxychorismate/anthranilate synthase component II [Alkalitalea saponilacus]SKB39612.1 anthranilate synthase component 2 [Alkalitalea saponilacus]